MTVIEGCRLERDFERRTRVLVIGTGAGGAVAAKELAEAGLDVLALEAGPHFTADHVDQREETTLPRIYAEGGRRGTRDRSLLVVQGRGIGGSTLHNTGLCFRTPRGILERWKREHGLELDLSRHLDRVERHLGVRPIKDDEVNPLNAAIERGARALSWKHVRANHNRIECEGCGYCVLGCAYDKKQGMALTYVPRARAAGATFLSDARVEKLSSSGGRWVARGRVLSEQGSPRASLTVTADAVVLASGAIDTPALLQRSGIGNALVGRSLRIHPSVPVAAVFDEKIRGFRGVPQSVIVMEHARFLEEGRGGFIVIPAFGQPATTATLTPGLGREHWELLRSYEHLAAAGVVLHDETRGTVRTGWLGPGRPRIDYWPSPGEQAMLADGARKLARLWLAAGAKRVHLPFVRAQPVANERELESLPDFAFVPHEVSVSSVHPQGTCPMGGPGKEGVLDENCAVRGAENLWVADASVFPTSVGVPPQLTTAALATRTAEHVAAKLGRGGEA